MAISFTARGRIELRRQDGSVISTHIFEREAVERASTLPSGTYRIVPPPIDVVVSDSAVTIVPVSGRAVLSSYGGGGVAGRQYFPTQIAGSCAVAVGASAAPDQSVLTWTSDLPSTISIAVGSFFDLEPYIYDPQGDATVSLDTGDSLPTGMSLAQTPTRRIVNTSATVGASTSNVNLVLTPSAETDWQSRISTSGVVWYHNFESANEVNNFRWTGGIGNDPQDSGTYPDCQWDSTDGFAGGGCILNRRAAGFSNDGSGWIRPYSPIVGGTTSGNGRGVGNDDPGASPRSWTVVQGGNQTENWPYGFYGNSTYHSEYPTSFDGQDYWIQMRVKTPATNWTQSGLTGGKCLFFQHTYGALPNQQIVLPAIVDTLTGAANGTGGRFILFRSGSPTLQSDHQTTHGVDASQVIEGETTAQSCNFGLRAANCWAFPGDTWVTLLFYYKLGLHSNSDTVVKVWAAYEGDSNNGRSYTLIWDQSCVDLPYDTGRPKGHNSVWTSGGANMSGTPTVDFVQKFTQFIFKAGNGTSSNPETDGIPCPQVY